MKNSNYIGIIAAIALIGCCFLPWAYIDSIKSTITGLTTEHTTFGKPGVLHIVFSVFSIILFMVPLVWAKGVNVFIGAFNFAWSIRNFLLVTHCELGECPHKRFGIYAIVFTSLVLMIMTMLPKMKLK